MSTSMPGFDAAQDEPAKKPHRILKRVLGAILAIFLVLVAVLGLYLSNCYSPDQEAKDCMTGDRTVSVSNKTGRGIIFSPRDEKNSRQIGIMFYPGGKVETQAYAPLCHKLAQQGFTVVLEFMPFNLAVLDINAAAGVQDRVPGMKSWYMAGHSVGGSMAAQFVSGHADEFDGIILLAAYSIADLSQTNLRGLVVCGTNDNVINKERYQKNLAKLPKPYVEHIIEGGNHSQFGNYGTQSGDGEATISADEQQEEAVDAIVDFIGKK